MTDFAAKREAWVAADDGLWAVFNGDRRVSHWTIPSATARVLQGCVASADVHHHQFTMRSQKDAAAAAYIAALETALAESRAACERVRELHTGDHECSTGGFSAEYDCPTIRALAATPSKEEANE